MERVINDRHGTVPLTDDADLYLLPVARCYRKIMIDNGKLVSPGDLMNRFGLWCDRWAPHLTADQATDIVNRVLADRLTFDRDDELGSSLRLTYADRHRLKITTIGSYDVDRKSRTKLSRARRRERNRLSAAEKRRAKGAKLRAVYEANSLSTTRPWEALGITRRTFERRRKKASSEQSGHIVASPSPHPLKSISNALATSAQNVTIADRLGATMPPAKAVGTHSKTIWFEGAEGVALVGDDRKRFKIRFPTAMRLTKEMKTYALETGFEPEKIQRMFEMFRDHNISQRTYSVDWLQTWYNWVNREAELVNEWYDRQRRRACFERRLAG